MSKYLFILLFSMFTVTGISQIPSGSFDKDSLSLGEHIIYTLTYSHPSGEAVLFPDANFNFYPFQLVSKAYFPTKTIGSISKDSAIYVFQSFEVDSVLKLGLPVFILQKGDSIVRFANSDSVKIIQNVGNINAGSIISDPNFIQIETSYNYKYAFGIAVISLFLFTILYLLFGKAVVRRYKLYVIRNAHLNFLKNFEKLEKEFKNEHHLAAIERALSLWKIYLTKLENKPISTYTSTEIINLYDQEDLQKGLQDIDKAIYGGVMAEEPEKALSILKKFSNKRFLLIKNQISDAK